LTTTFATSPTIALAGFTPAQHAMRAHQATKDFRGMTRMQDNQAHSFENPLLNPLHHRVGHLPMSKMPPPGEHIGLGEQRRGQPVLRFLQRRRADLHGIARMLGNRRSHRGMYSIGVKPRDLGAGSLVNEFVPHGHAQGLGHGVRSLKIEKVGS